MIWFFFWFQQNDVNSSLDQKTLTRSFTFQTGYPHNTANNLNYSLLACNQPSGGLEPGSTCNNKYLLPSS
jgi:hypothetical protein